MAANTAATMISVSLMRGKKTAGMFMKAGSAATISNAPTWIGSLPGS